MPLRALSSPTPNVVTIAAMPRLTRALPSAAYAYYPSRRISFENEADRAREQNTEATYSVKFVGVTDPVDRFMRFDEIEEGLCMIKD